MASCKTAEFLYWALPLRPVRSWLIKVHVEACPRCQERLVSRVEAGALFVDAGSEALPEGLGRKVEELVFAPGRGARRTVPSVRRDLGWNWIASASVVAVTVAAALWLLTAIGPPPGPAGPVPGTARFEVGYVKIGGEPARSVVYRPAGSDMVIVWAEKQL